jgi:hypothetical protein
MKKKSIKSGFIMLLLALVMLVGVMFTSPVSALFATFISNERADDTVTVYMTFEGYNLGQGFYIEPTALTLPMGATAEDATRMLLDQTGHTFISFGSDSTFYLSRVNGFDTGVINPPSFITESLGARSGDGSLGEFDYTFMSGWMLTGNHMVLPVSAGAYTLHDQEVIRWQFTVQGFGEDLGIDSPLYTHADKTALLQGLFAYEATSAARQDALDVVINPLSTSKEVEGALMALRSSNEPEQPENPEPEQPEEPESIPTEVTFIRVPRGANVGVFRKGSTHFASFENSFDLTLIPSMSDANEDVYGVTLPFNVDLHVEAIIPGETIKQVRVFRVAQHGMTIEMSLTPLSEWTPVDNGSRNANMYTNLDDTGTLNLNVGEVFYLDTFRVWQAMDGVTANYFIEPNYLFDLSGNSAHIQRVGSPGREQLKIEATTPGVSVIKVSYDPIEYVTRGGGTHRFNAIDSRNTVSVVVNVNGGADFNTGITMRNDFDTAYFDIENGYRAFTFTPASGSSVRVHDPLNQRSWGNGWRSYDQASDGSFTVQLRDGRNIIEVQNGSSVRYHVVKARGIEVDVINVTSPGMPFSEGDTARISLRGIETPIEKLAGIYNPGVPGFFGSPDLRPTIRYSNGQTTLTSNRGGQYSTLTDAFTIDYLLTNSDLNVLDGQIHLGVMGDLPGSHRNIPLNGVRPNMNSIAHGPFPFGMLPEIVLPVNGVDISSQLTETLDLLVALEPEPEFSITGGEWTIIPLARSGHAVPIDYFEGYHQRVVNLVKELNGILTVNRFTDYSRLVVALHALNEDPRDVGGHNLLARVLEYDHVVRQGINGPIWALIALNSRDFEASEVSAFQEVQERYIEFILERELASGGFALAGQNADPDMTAMALYALASHRDHPEVQSTIDRGVERLAAIQRPDGGFASWGSANSQSSAQVVIALTTLGIDPVTDSRFVVNGHNPLTALLSFYVPGGGFRNLLSGSLDGMATEQGAMALVAYDRFVRGERALFDMRDADGELDEVIPPRETARLTIQAPDVVRGQKDITFNAIVRTDAFPEGDYRLLNGIIEIPEALIVDEIMIPNTLTGGSLLWHYDPVDHVVRFVYTNTELNLLEFRATTFEAELFSLQLRVHDDVDLDTTVEATISIRSTDLKESSDAPRFSFDVSEAWTTITFYEFVGGGEDGDGEDDGNEGGDGVEVTTLSIREVFRGDGVDLIPADLRAMAVAVDNIPDGVKLIYREEFELYFSPQMTDKQGTLTYIFMVDVDESDDDLMDPANYKMVKDTLAETVVFGDTTGNGVVNAQDALNVLTAWLRVTEVETTRQILTMNVNADERIDSLDALAMMEYFVSHLEFVIIGK